MQKLQLSIPEPCHENWQQMTPTEQGRFCNACAKEVVDFSTMTDLQVLNYFSTLTNEKVCGRALPEQLNRTISRPETPKKRLFWYWNYFVMFFMFFTKGNAAKAQGGVKPVTECSPVKPNDVKGEVRMVGKIKAESSHVITGKVTDIDGNPIPFASVKIKGTTTGVSADAAGVYSIRLKTNTVLIISAFSFIPTAVTVGSENVINSVLKRDSSAIDEFKAVTVGAIVFRNPDSYYSPPDKIKAVAIIRVKDEGTGKSLQNASIEILTDKDAVTALTDRKGVYKIKKIKEYGHYYIKVTAEGYEGTEFTINESDFKDRKKEWEVLLRKQKVEDVRSSATTASKNDTPIRIRPTISFGAGRGSLYVVDGIIMPNGADIKPDDVETYSVLQGPEATALFGPDGANGAIVITTRKAKEKSLEEVVITGAFGVRRTIRCGVSCVNVTSLEDSIKALKDPGTSLKPGYESRVMVYPNPVQRSNSFNIAFELKQTGSYQLLITDVNGRVVLQKQINALRKTFTENIAADSRWSSGLYQVSLIDNTNKLINKTSFIFK